MSANGTLADTLLQQPLACDRVEQTFPPLENRYGNPHTIDLLAGQLLSTSRNPAVRSVAAAALSDTNPPAHTRKPRRFARERLAPGWHESAAQRRRLRVGRPQECQAPLAARGNR